MRTQQNSEATGSAEILSDLMPLPRAFRGLAWSNLAAQSAEQVALAAMPIVAVVALGAGAGETGMLQLVGTLPFVLLAIPIGILVDRVSRARLMAGAEGLRVLSLVSIFVLAMFGQLSLLSLALLGFVGACGTAVYSVAAPALVPSLVPPDALSRANGRIELARTIAFTAGPALGGALVGWAGASPAFALAAALSVAAVLLLLRIEEGTRPPVVSRHPLTEIAEGAAFVSRHPLLRSIFIIQIVFNTSFFVVQAVFVPYAMSRLGMSPAAVGLTLAAYGGAMVLGALVGARLMNRLRFGTVVATGPISALIGSAVLALTIWVPSPALAGIAWFLFGAGPILWVISTTTVRQAVTPSRLLGRVSAINVIAWGARPLGAGIGAVVGSRFGEDACLVLAVAGFAVQAAMVLASPLARLRGRPPMVGDLPPEGAQPLRPAR